MAREEVMLQFLYYSLLLSAALAGAVGWYSNWSFKKMLITYGAGVLCAMVVVIPDWEFFKRPPSEWCIPMASDPQSAAAQKARFQILDSLPDSEKRLNFYPLRIVLFTAFYGFILFTVCKYIFS